MLPTVPCTHLKYNLKVVYSQLNRYVSVTSPPPTIKLLKFQIHLISTEKSN